MPKFKIQHITTYHYEIPVRDSANQIMLYPFNDERQEVVLHELYITGNPAVEVHQDVFNNRVGTFTHSQPHKELIINSILEVVTTPIEPPQMLRNVETQWNMLQQIRFEFPYIDFLRNEIFRSLPELKKVMSELDDQKEGPLASARKFLDYVFKNFTYKKGITTVDTTLDEIWELRSGVCQDFAHILLAMLKLVNIPARYVSGYICPNKNGMRGEGATHAWVEAYMPEYGWIGLDPTNNCITNENHVRLAVGKNFYDCSPVRGTYRGSSDHTLEVAVTVSYDGAPAPQSEEKNIEVIPSKSFSKNSFRRYQEMQMQQ
jgi:transglutaminase-like putative cysteine protease